MSKIPPVSMASMNPGAMGNLNRMAILMKISEITPQICISGYLLFFFLHRIDILYQPGQMAATLEQVHKLGITYILNVAVESSAIVYPKHVKLEKYDIIDFPTAKISDYFNTLTDKIHTHLAMNRQNKVLVHCMAGISRSTTIVCAYLMRYMNLSLRDAYLLCKRQRPICFPNLGFWNQLITYEYQLRRENSVKMISSQFGIVPDVALEEIRQLRNQQQQQPVSLPFYAPTFAPPISTPSITSPSSNDSLFLSSNQTRPTARDVPSNNPAGTMRSRSLATNTNNRTSTNATSNNNNNNNPAYQTPIFATNKQVFSTPARFVVGPLNPPPLPSTNISSSGPTSSSTSYYNSRNLPISTSPNIRPRANPYQQQSNVATALSNPSSSSSNSGNNNGQARGHYETTYRSSFARSLVP